MVSVDTYSSLSINNNNNNNSNISSRICNSNQNNSSLTSKIIDIMKVNGRKTKNKQQDNEDEEIDIMNDSDEDLDITGDIDENKITIVNNNNINNNNNTTTIPTTTTTTTSTNSSSSKKKKSSSSSLSSSSKKNSKLSASSSSISTTTKKSSSKKSSSSSSSLSKSVDHISDSSDIETEYIHTKRRTTSQDTASTSLQQDHMFLPSAVSMSPMIDVISSQDVMNPSFGLNLNSSYYQSPMLDIYTLPTPSLGGLPSDFGTPLDEKINHSFIENLNTLNNLNSSLGNISTSNNNNNNNSSSSSSSKTTNNSSSSKKRKGKTGDENITTNEVEKDHVNINDNEDCSKSSSKKMKVSRSSGSGDKKEEEKRSSVPVSSTTSKSKSSSSSSSLSKKSKSKQPKKLSKSKSKSKLSSSSLNEDEQLSDNSSDMDVNISDCDSSGDEGPPTGPMYNTPKSPLIKSNNNSKLHNSSSNNSKHHHHHHHHHHDSDSELTIIPSTPAATIVNNKNTYYTPLSSIGDPHGFQSLSFLAPFSPVGFPIASPMSPSVMDFAPLPSACPLSPLSPLSPIMSPVSPSFSSSGINNNNNNNNNGELQLSSPSDSPPSIFSNRSVFSNIIVTPIGGGTDIFNSPLSPNSLIKSINAAEDAKSNSLVPSVSATSSPTNGSPNSSSSLSNTSVPSSNNITSPSSTATTTTVTTGGSNSIVPATSKRTKRFTMDPHVQKHFQLTVWYEEEKLFFKELFCAYGRDWQIISTLMCGTKSPTQIKNFYYDVKLTLLGPLFGHSDGETSKARITLPKNEIVKSDSSSSSSLSSSKDMPPPITTTTTTSLPTLNKSTSSTPPPNTTISPPLNINTNSKRLTASEDDIRVKKKSRTTKRIFRFSRITTPVTRTPKNVPKPSKVKMNETPSFVKYTVGSAVFYFYQNPETLPIGKWFEVKILEWENTTTSNNNNSSTNNNKNVTTPVTTTTTTSTTAMEISPLAGSTSLLDGLDINFTDLNPLVVDSAIDSFTNSTIDTLLQPLTPLSASPSPSPAITNVTPIPVTIPTTTTSTSTSTTPVVNTLPPVIRYKVVMFNMNKTKGFWVSEDELKLELDVGQ